MQYTQLGHSSMSRTFINLALLQLPISSLFALELYWKTDTEAGVSTGGSLTVIRFCRRRGYN